MGHYRKRNEAATNAGTRTKTSTLPLDLIEGIERQRERISRDLGVSLSFSQALATVARRGLEALE